MWKMGGLRDVLGGSGCAACRSLRLVLCVLRLRGCSVRFLEHAVLTEILNTECHRCDVDTGTAAQLCCWQWISL